MATRTVTKPNRPGLDEMGLSQGKKARLYSLIYEHGLKNGTLLLLPIDQGLEHGPIDFFDNPESMDPDFQYRLAVEGGFNGIALHIGLAEKYGGKYAGRVPLILKLNGKTAIPSDDEAFSPLTGTVEDAVRLGALAVGYTLFVGSPRQDEDFNQFNELRYDAERLGMPVIVWSYPRGREIESKGGRDSYYAVDYAARVACELGADVVKLNMPKPSHEKNPKPYPSLQHSDEERMAKVVRSSGRTLVLVSGGSKMGDEDLLAKVGIAMRAGSTGLIFGRNMWQRPFDKALDITKKVKEILARHGA
jgi:class I fructose-bisphosphate aldolase